MMMTMKKLGLCAALLLLAAPAAQADDAKVKVELNKLEPGGAACRAYLVVENTTASAFETLKLDLVMFDPDGVVARRFAVEIAPLPASKTSLKAFDIDGLPCDRVGRVLLNDVMDCADASGARSDCLALISVSARGALKFVK